MASIKYAKFNLKNILGDHGNNMTLDNKMLRTLNFFSVNLRSVAKGFSLMEILVAVGIMAAISGIATMAYLDYLNEGRLTVLGENARNFFKAAELCLIRRDDQLSKCNTKEKLKFNCEGCTVAYNSGGGHQYHWERVVMHVSSGNCNLCASYRPEAPNVPKRTLLKCKEGWKFCVRSRNYSKHYDWTTKTWVNTSVTGNNARIPYQRCSSASDCKTGEICHEFNKGEIFDNGLGRGAICL